MVNIPEEIIKSTAEKFVAMLQEVRGKGEWIKPFFNNSCPYNFESKKEYRGFNTLLLSCIENEMGYTSSKWGTFEQWKKAKRIIKKGEKGRKIIFWNYVKVAKDETETEEEEKTIPFMRYYTVFNECQLSDYSEEKLSNIDENILEKVNNFKTSYLDRIGACYSEEHGRACYVPSLDIIKLPSINQYKKDMLEEYIPTACHETVHWSGAKHRLNRDLSGRFGDESYALEELIADIGAGFVSQRYGVNYMFSQNNLKYIESWISILKEHPKVIMTACSYGQKAADYLLKLASEE